jgi:hypothetical protein
MDRMHTTTTESLTRWLSAWLAVAVCLQALAVCTLGLRVAAHRHGTAQVESKPVLLWHHAGDRADHRSAHALAHALDQAHGHAPDDASVLGSDAHATALAAWVGAPAPRPRAAPQASDLRHVRAVPGDSWVPTARVLAPPLRPPRV